VFWASESLLSCSSRWVGMAHWVFGVLSFVAYDQDLDGLLLMGSVTLPHTETSAYERALHGGLAVGLASVYKAGGRRP